MNLKKAGDLMSKAKEVTRTLVTLPLEAIKPYAKNPRLNNKAVAYVKKSIQEFGMNSPLGINSNNVLLYGHTRLLALKELGYKEVDCYVIDGLTRAQENAFRIADNKTAEYSEWDIDLLSEEVKALKLEGNDNLLAGLGFNELDLNGLLASDSQTNDFLASLQQSEEEEETAEASEREIDEESTSAYKEQQVQLKFLKKAIDAGAYFDACKAIQESDLSYHLKETLVLLASKLIVINEGLVGELASEGNGELSDILRELGY